MSVELEKKIKQLPLDLGHRPAQDREDFLVAPSNQMAVSFIDSWPEWPAPLLVLQGAAASGKTHLTKVWTNHVQAVSIDPAQLLKMNASEIAEQGEHLAIDGLDPWLGDREAETTLFHLYNIIKEEQRTMLIAMRMAPTGTDFAIKDLASRFRAAPVAAIEEPDDSLLSAILVKLFIDRQIQVDADAITYLLPRIERTFSAVRDVVKNADRLAMSKKRPVSIPLLRDVLADMQAEP